MHTKESEGTLKNRAYKNKTRPECSTKDKQGAVWASLGNVGVIMK